MPRISNLDKSKNTVFKTLFNIKSRLDARTYAAFERKIYNTNRKDVVAKLSDQLRLIESSPPLNNEKKLTTSSIKQQEKRNKIVKETKL
jgi:hypothetical protein